MCLVPGLSHFLSEFVNMEAAVRTVGPSSQVIMAEMRFASQRVGRW